MRLTLWQQFSSNHSAGFMVVGKFESVEWAETVAGELRSMLREIGQWWEQYDSENYMERDRILGELIQQKKHTPPEEKFAAQYGVEWSRHEISKRIEPLDWVYDQKAADAVRTWNDLVIVQPIASWQGPTPFDAVMRKLGGEVAAWCATYDTYFAVNLTCKAPNDATADKIMSEIQYMERGPIKLLLVPKLYYAFGKVERDGTKITFHHYQMRSLIMLPPKRPIRKKRRDPDEWRKITFEQQLQGLVDYVRGHGCTDIEYSFVEAPSSPEY